MKKTFLLIAIVLGLIATQVNAQQIQNRYGKQPQTYSRTGNQVSPVRFGVRVGGNLAQWEGESVNSAQDLLDLTDGSASRKMREGFHVGAYVSIPVIPGFEIEPGLQYSQKGTKLTGKLPLEGSDFLNANLTVTNKAEYIDVPVLARVYVGEGFNFFVGPQVSYLVSNKVKAEAGALGFNALNREWDMNSGFRDVDVAVTGGLGYRFTSGFNISAGYDYGLSTIDSNGNFDTYNRVVKASLGYTF
ncbi:PorT family protein [Pontibacter sp. 172403-2]|uniref:porin family protein n=1 Tax=Pontibacter rufus TaxID=2791028 RepID=UPI0018AFB43C|nr:porin family protein [Pontibacter sp. 172403-2]MBF9254251.1 PorT family protein [Pontibacter sp. 172403-2]